MHPSHPFCFALAASLLSPSALAAECPFPAAAPAIAARWQASGGPNGALLGPATTDVGVVPNGNGCFQGFRDGSVYWTSSLGAHMLRGGIRDAWNALGGENGQLGFPISEEKAPRVRSPNRVQDFENGVLYWNAHDGTAVELEPYYPATRDRSQMEVALTEAVYRMLTPHADQIYVTDAPTIAEVSNYALAGPDQVRNRTYKLNIPLKYHAAFLGIDLAAPEPSTSLDVWILMTSARTRAETRLQATLWSWNARTTVPFPTSLSISPGTVNNLLKTEVLSNVLGKTEIVGTVPGELTVLSTKVMPGGDFRIYVEPPSGT